MDNKQKLIEYLGKICGAEKAEKIIIGLEESYYYLAEDGLYHIEPYLDYRDISALEEITESAIENGYTNSFDIFVDKIEEFYIDYDKCLLQRLYDILDELNIESEQISFIVDIFYDLICLDNESIIDAIDNTEILVDCSIMSKQDYDTESGYQIIKKYLPNIYKDIKGCYYNYVLSTQISMTAREYFEFLQFSGKVEIEGEFVLKDPACGCLHDDIHNLKIKTSAKNLRIDYGYSISEIADCGVAVSKIKTLQKRKNII